MSVTNHITKDMKIARENLTVKEKTSPLAEGQQYEWKKLVGSIRRRVQRNASTSCPSDSTDASVGDDAKIHRKNSLTRSKFDVFKWDKSKEDAPGVLEKGKKEACKTEKKEMHRTFTLTKQKSIGSDLPSRNTKFKALSFRDKPKSTSFKNIDTLISPKSSKSSFILNRGVRKSDQSSDKMQKSNVKNSEQIKKSVGICQKLKGDKNVNKDDFLKATMRIFLVVSPPVGKLQVTYIYYIFIHLR
ncbi:hypothetical protein FQA39_LY11600 [Lamprigera yunnana]|nr:hypothetical protein FQA39_LY11600 [Lamprigera yunnana]